MLTLFPLGTPAGDPIEAEAIATAFFGKDYGVKAPGNPLYVGSIKTILGHTEGTAGVAALMKASLAIQHSIIPPNMLLNSMSDRVAPFAKNLEIVKTATPWPELLPGQPKRASVNSFVRTLATIHKFTQPCSNVFRDSVVQMRMQLSKAMSLLKLRSRKNQKVTSCSVLWYFRPSRSNRCMQILKLMPTTSVAIHP